MQKFLVVRGEDMLHFNLQWENFQLEYEGSLPGSCPRLVAMSGEAHILLTFPPQVLGEQVMTSEESYSTQGTLGSRRSGTSRVQFKVPEGTVLELNAEGVLKALSSPGVCLVLNDTLGEESTAIEIPWGLIISVVPEFGEGTVVSNHAVLPVRSNAGVTGLWHTQLRASNGEAENAGLGLLPLYNFPQDLIWFSTPPVIIGPPLVALNREQIYQSGRHYYDFDLSKLPHVKRLELSTLGGSLSVTTKWPDFEWDHEVVIGRDKRIRVVRAGVLYPFGHRAYVEVLTEREFYDGDAVLRNTKAQLVVTEPVRYTVADDRKRREFPFDKVEILTRTFDIDAPPYGEGIFVPEINQRAMKFPIHCTGTNGDIFFNVELVFTYKEFTNSTDSILEKWRKFSKIPLQGIPMDMVRSERRSNDAGVYEVYELNITGDPHEGVFYPKINEFTAELPTLRELLPQKTSKPILLKYTKKFINYGDDEEIVLETPENIEINFMDRPDYSGGLIAPNYVAKQISRISGPIPPLDGDAAAIFNDAKLLGVSLGSVIKNYSEQGPPKIIQVQGNPKGVKMEWKNISLKDCLPFKTDNSTVTLTVERSPLNMEITCEVENFKYILPGNLVILKFDSLKFTQKSGRAIDLQIGRFVIKFDGELKLVGALLTELNKLLGEKKPTLRTTPSGISAEYTLSIPDIATGMFLMRNISIHCGVNIPFSTEPVTMSLGFGRRDNPFNLSVLMFGGGGYIDVEFGGNGRSRLEGSMEFGGTVAVNFIIARAEVHALGGVHFHLAEGIYEFGAFIRIGGSIKILGLVSVAVELVVKLDYKDGNRLVGRATLVIDVDVTLFSESVTIDSGEWELLGSNTSRMRNTSLHSPEDMDRSLSSLMKYYEAFEQV